jgi:hypothetical protein
MYPSIATIQAKSGILIRRTAWGDDMMRAIVLAVAAAALCACGTPYQDMGFRGGVAAEQITTDTFRIKSRGNGYTAKSTIQDYVLLKAAETTKTAGGTHFQIINAADASRKSVESGATTSVVGHTAFTTYSSEVVVKPGEDTIIRVLRVPPGQQTTGLFNADEIIQFIGSRVKRET